MSFLSRGTLLAGLAGAGAVTLSVLALQTPPAPAGGTQPLVRPSLPTSSSSAAPVQGVTLPPVAFDPPATGAKVLVLGGRISEGFFASSAEQSYTGVLTRRLVAEQRLTGLQVETEMTTSAGATLKRPPAQHLVVLEVGSEENLPIRQFIQQYGRLSQQVREESPDAAVVCLGIWGGAGNDVDLQIRRACSAIGGRFVRLSDLFERNPLKGPAGTEAANGTRDNFHPNDVGHELIANRVFDAVVTTPVVQPTPSTIG